MVRHVDACPAAHIYAHAAEGFRFSRPTAHTHAPYSRNTCCGAQRVYKIKDQAVKAEGGTSTYGVKTKLVVAESPLWKPFPKTCVLQYGVSIPCWRRC
jgi:hypothetical protein